MSTQENNIMTLSEVLDAYDKGTLDMSQSARKCYLTERDKHYNKVTWVHNDELKNQLLLRSMGKSANRDLLRNTKNPLQG